MTLSRLYTIAEIGESSWTATTQRDIYIGRDHRQGYTDTGREGIMQVKDWGKTKHGELFADA